MAGPKCNHKGPYKREAEGDLKGRMSRAYGSEGRKGDVTWVTSQERGS